MNLIHMIIIKGSDGEDQWETLLTSREKEYIDRNDIIESDSLENIIKEALKFTESGDVVLLSPGCTSFGLFKNEFHRGDVFNKLVRAL